MRLTKQALAILREEKDSRDQTGAEGAMNALLAGLTTRALVLQASEHAVLEGRLPPKAQLRSSEIFSSATRQRLDVARVSGALLAPRNTPLPPVMRHEQAPLQLHLAGLPPWR